MKKPKKTKSKTKTRGGRKSSTRGGRKSSTKR